jgi:2-hydroxychromene-2-carboxylate isomerase
MSQPRRHIDWYYDFISPFAYFGFLRLRELGDVDISHHPVLLAELLKRHGHKGPAEIPAKRTWTYRSCVWWATQQGVPFRFPAAHPFNPLPYLRLAIAAGNSPQAIGRIFEALWTTGADPADPNVVVALASALGVEPAQITSDEGKQQLRLETEHAAERGMFGVPTYLVDGQLFWGADATDFVKAYLADPGVLGSEEMQRVSALPVGVVRK